MSKKIYDVIIIGSGPAGYVGAIRGKQLGLEVCVIEKEKIGGVCLNKGCIPTKAQIAMAKKYRHAFEMTHFGLGIEGNIDFSKVQEKSADVSSQLSKGVEYLFKKNEIDSFMATAKIISATEVELDNGEVIEGKNIIVATGSAPRQLPFAPFDGEKILSSDDILRMTELPESMIIIGGGAIGTEWAYILKSFGVEVTIIEMLEHILPAEDEEAAKTLERALKKQKIKLNTSTKVLSIEKGDSMTVAIEDKKGRQKELTADKVLIVTGRGPVTDKIGLENVNIETERGFIPVGDYYETSVPGIYAVGDVVASPLLAHLASREAEIAIEHIAGHTTITKVDPNSVPRAVYCEPQIASFGHSKESAEAAGLEFTEESFQFRGIGKAVAIDEKDGLVKLILSKDKKLLGAVIVGADATEMIHELLLAHEAQLDASVIAETIHAHPTLSEGIMEAAKEAFDGAIHN